MAEAHGRSSASSPEMGRTERGEKVQRPLALAMLIKGAVGEPLVL